MQTKQTVNNLSAAQTAQARSLAYDLFARLFLQGPTDSNRDAIKAIPELVQVLGNLLGSTEADSDRAASNHFHLFGFNVFPYQDMFLSSEGSLGGQQSQRVLDYYQQAGFILPPHSPTRNFAAGESPDHIGLELAFLSFLCGAEADALQDSEGQYVFRIQNLQRDFFDQHLLPWLPVLVQAVMRQGLPFYTELAKLALELAFDHRSELGKGNLVRQAAFALPHPPSLLEDEKTGLKEIAAYLLTPAFSGFYLSREDIARLGRRYKLPRGFGDRTQMLANLLRSAVDYDHLPLLIADLQALVDEWKAAYQALGEPGSTWEPYSHSWMERLDSTRALLLQVRSG